MSRRWTLLASAFLVAMSALFCTLGPSGGGAGGPPASVSDTERIAALDDITAAVQDSRLPDGLINRTAVLEHLQADARFEAAGQAPDGSIWANFKDGRMVIIPPEIPHDTGAPFPPPPLPEDGTPTGMNSAGGAIRAAAAPDISLTGKHLALAASQGAAEFALPESETAVTMSSLGASYVGDASRWIDRALRKAKYKSTLLTASVEDLGKVKGVGVFYFATHGGTGCAGKFADCLAGAPTSALTYVLWTSTPVSVAMDAKYAADLTGKLLAYALADPGDKKPLEWHYAITSKFVSTRMSFSENSLVYIEGCSSLSIADAFGSAGASWFVGWTLPAGPYDQAFYFFDRLLGLGHDVTDRVKKAEPPNRPFDAGRVMDSMEWLGLVRSLVDEGWSTLKLVPLREGPGVLLAPSIQRLKVDEAAKELTLLGTFGTEQGVVTINKVEAAVKEWAGDKIRVSLPAADKTGGSGDVVVKVRDHESNAVPLTKWYVNFTYTEEPDFEMQGYNWLYLDVYWRADVHRYRLQPDLEVYDQEEVTLEPAEGSSGRWECDWTGTVATLRISTIEGEGKLPFTREPGAVGFTSTARLVPENRQITNLSFTLNFDPEHTCVTETTGAGVTVQTVGGFVELPGLLEEISPDFPVTPPLVLDEQWVLKGANRDLNADGQWPWLKWADTQGQPAPKNDKTPG